MIESMKNAMVSTGTSWVIWVLAALSVVSAGIAAERAWFFWRRKDDLPALLRNLHHRLLQHDLVGADAVLRASASVEASVGAAGLAQWGSGPAAVAEAMSAATGMERARLERRLGFLGTMGNNALFIGLLGTVIGIVGAFGALGQTAGIAAAGAVASERVMSTIAEALVTTALGLVVAIPAVALFNHLQGLKASAIDGAETLGHLLLSHLQGEAYSLRLLDSRSARAPAKNDNMEANWIVGEGA